ncbi:MAG TPA: lysylphosphatidylglycerol synthase transmembrane domain-containing protein [Methylococcus sp.]|nr:lysylphosphatidylglycerol synthase transmembrane domain-containing protein [Methylococcus sp.]
MKPSPLLKQFNPTRILLPVCFGLGIVVWMLYSEWIREGLRFPEIFDRIEWNPRTLLWFFTGIAMLAIREFGYIWQLRILTGNRLPWRSCFEIVLLWDFFAAVSPSMVGGTAIGLFMLVKERLSVGHSTAIVFTTIFLDQAFYTATPFVVSYFIPQHDVFAPLQQIRSEWIGTSMLAAFWSAWSTLLVYVLFLIAALFIAPGWINWWLRKLLSLPLLKHWRDHGRAMANDLMLASRDLRNRSTGFWLKVWLATSVAWMGRYLVLNCVIAAFSEREMGLYDHLLVLGRQAVLWVLMVVSPTPGSAGVAELGFSWLFRDLTPGGTALTIAVLWRLIAYYPFLVAGIPIMTRWVTRIYGRDVRN